MDDDLKTLDYWADVEALTPTSVDSETSAAEFRKDPDDAVFYVRDGRMPWEGGLPSKRPCVHFVYFGILDRLAYERELRDVLSAHPEPPDPGGRKRAEPLTFLGVIEVGQDLRSVSFDPLRHLAAFAPAFAGLRAVNADAYDEAMRLCISQLADEIAASEDPEPVIGIGFFRALVTEACRLLDWTAPLSPQVEVVVVRKACVNKEGRARTPDIPPINGFYLDDIRRARTAIRSGADFGLVRRYLRDEPVRPRRDCRDHDVIDAALSLDTLPTGRWPSPFPLTLMQQVAVNQGLADLDEGGLFSVNGPPGTGKTTLLADVVASVYVTRASRLSGFGHPRDAFSSAGPGPGAASARYVLNPDLRDFLIVVASSNNGAVENVTRELPDIGKIAEPYREACSIFRETAKVLLNRRAPTQVDEQGDGDERDAIAGAQKRDAWGLVSVPLGKGANRFAFQAVAYAKEKVAPGRPPEDAPHNLFRMLEELPEKEWRRACDVFRKSVASVEAIKSELRELEELESRLSVSATGRERAKQEAHDAGEALAASIATQEDVTGLLARRAAAVARADEAVVRTKPHFLIWLLAQIGVPHAAVTALRAHDGALVEREDAAAKLREAERDADGIADRVRAHRAVAGVARAALEEAQRRLAADASRVEAIRARHPGLTAMPSRAEMSSNQDRVQQLLPRSSATLNEARAAVFAAAVGVHRAFLGSAKTQVKRNLSLALRMLSGKVQHTADEALDLWASLALFVPVVSSTFAAFSRCFSAVPAGGIAWLVVDEAGQAPPQAAVGALLRSKRALVVGDPLQVPPVITLDERTDQRLQERWDARRIHRSTETSMQSLADRINPFGTTIRGSEDDVWVGSPLIVHRRCVEPMFSISNNIAYDGGMVLGDGKVEEEARLTLGDPEAGVERRPLLGPSCWIDIPNESGGEGHFMASHGLLASRLLSALAADVASRMPHGLPDAFVISPFKTVGEGMRNMLDPASLLWAHQMDPKKAKAWVSRCVGTVHTFQGKEAETVVLVLGGRTAGAIKWAASTPNILNVAVTRARRRLYVIGDWNAWMRQPAVKGCIGTISGFRVSSVEFEQRLAGLTRQGSAPAPLVRAVRTP